MKNKLDTQIETFESRFATTSSLILVNLFKRLKSLKTNSWDKHMGPFRKHVWAKANKTAKLDLALLHASAANTPVPEPDILTNLQSSTSKSHLMTPSNPAL